VGGGEKESGGKERGDITREEKRQRVKILSDYSTGKGTQPSGKGHWVEKQSSRGKE